MSDTNWKPALGLGTLAFLLLLWWHSARPSADAAENDRPSSSSRNDSIAAIRMTPTATDLPGLQNTMQLTPRIYSGGEPQGPQAFERLHAMGIRTVVSVDGIRPDVESARRNHLRYVHIPIGYDGVNKQAVGSLARLVKEADGPFYIHCHHGHHRGPAAAAVAAILAEALSNGEAIEALNRAGTSQDYAGLWRDVRHCQPLAAETDWPELVEVAEVDSLAAAMARIDRTYHLLGQCQAAGWQTPSDHPDLVPAKLAILLREGFRESQRHLEDKSGQQLQHWMIESEAFASDLQHAIEESDSAAADGHLVQLKQSCKQCHVRFRN